jgi:E3 ubiquitin-protein ligase RNF31
VKTYEQAELAASLLRDGFDRDDALNAARECSCHETAIAFLQQECELCTAKVPMSQVYFKIIILNSFFFILKK